jgi:hypothetical protein
MSNSKPEIFVYKMVADNGGAPCVAGNLLSLAICKPKIRKSAGKDALVFGFGGKGYGERLIYIARVTTKLEGDAYYREREYARRPDCIYRVEYGQPVRKASAKYHFDSDQRKKDVGFHFENAFVLLSDDFRYLGKRGTEDFKKRYPKLRRLIVNLKQGHRRHHSVALRNELLSLKAEIWKKHRRMKVGSPTDIDRSRTCNGDCPIALC